MSGTFCEEPTTKLAFAYRGTATAIVTLNGVRLGELKFDSEFARDTFQQWMMEAFSSRSVPR